MRWSSPQRNAASVLPDPVGALMRTCSPVAIAGQACSCTGVGASKARSNHSRTAGVNTESGTNIQATRRPYADRYGLPELSAGGRRRRAAGVLGVPAADRADELEVRDGTRDRREPEREEAVGEHGDDRLAPRHVEGDQ